MRAREQILGAIQQRLGRGQLRGQDRAALDERLENPTPNLIPARVTEPGSDLVAMFVEYASREQVTISRCDRDHDVPSTVSKYLRENGLELEVILTPDPGVTGLPWANTPITISGSSLERDGQAAVTGCYAAIAENGVVVTVSSALHPAEINFMPATHIVVLPVGSIIASCEALWAKLRSEPVLPRSVHMLLGPSRSADIELTLEIGAHGPQRFHVILVG